MTDASCSALKGGKSRGYGSCEYLKPHFVETLSDYFTCGLDGRQKNKLEKFTRNLSKRLAYYSRWPLKWNNGLVHQNNVVIVWRFLWSKSASTRGVGKEEWYVTIDRGGNDTIRKKLPRIGREYGQKDSDKENKR